MQPTSLAFDLCLSVDGLPENRVTACLAFKQSSGIVGLVGASGSGKSTLIRTLAGLHRPLSGRILVDGVPWFLSDGGVDLPFEARSVSYLPQGASLFPHMNVKKNLLFADRLEDDVILSKVKIKSNILSLLEKSFHRNKPLPKRVHDLADRFGIEDLLDRRTEELSGGQRMKVALVRCFLKPARIYLLDEPLTGIDPETRKRFGSIILGILRERRALALWVTHAPDELLSLSEGLLRLTKERSFSFYEKEPKRVSWEFGRGNEWSGGGS